jgi:hypothetical protein
MNGSSGSSDSCSVEYNLPTIVCYNKPIMGSAWASGPGAGTAVVTVTYPNGSTVSGVGSVTINYVPNPDDFRRVSFVLQASCNPTPRTVDVIVAKEFFTQTPSPLSFKTVVFDANIGYIEVTMNRVAMSALIQPASEFDLKNYLIDQYTVVQGTTVSGGTFGHPYAFDTSGDANLIFYDKQDVPDSGPRYYQPITANDPTNVKTFEFTATTTFHGPVGNFIITWGYGFSVNYAQSSIDPYLIGPTFSDPCGQ